MKSSFRVKYLDKEDLESLGFEFLNEQRHMHEFKKDKYYLEYCFAGPYFKEVQIYYDGKGDDWRYVFDGTIKNKSELKVLLKQLGIQ